ncbi:LADA_0H07932g1_1 [Lachancea dasiensis]|uniref:LADA_0H07932g1_1 n=1 Tax=Lachancea dasiensis TaxID=1072105 RepID=A0A1G4K2B6_9SACH|nr:LADA_0H07932g1_1 [Lachancea dasiensis]
MSDGDYAEQLRLQRQAFEAQFGSLESMGFEDKTKAEQQQNEELSEDTSLASEDSGGESDGASCSDSNENESFEGFSDHDFQTQDKSNTTQRQPKVIKFDGSSDVYVAPSKKEQKIIRSGRAPGKTLLDAKLEEDLIKASENDTGDVTNDGEKENLQKDLELQRFLKESHLLSAFGNNSPSGADLTLQTMDNVEYKDDQLFGKARSRTLEMRLKNLASVNGKAEKLEKVPMNIRRGMTDKHIKRIKKHEHEAREGGIVLSKVKKGEYRKIDATYRKDIERRIGHKNASNEAQRRAKRQKGLKVHSVGRSTRNGLIISPDEIKRINGAPGKVQKGKGRRR